MSEETVLYRRIDDLGRIVIPKIIRNHIGLREGEAMKIEVDTQGRVILEKYNPEQK